MTGVCNETWCRLERVIIRRQRLQYDSQVRSLRERQLVGELDALVRGHHRQVRCDAMCIIESMYSIFASHCACPTSNNNKTSGECVTRVNIVQEGENRSINVTQWWSVTTNSRIELIYDVGTTFTLPVSPSFSLHLPNFPRVSSFPTSSPHPD